MTFILAILGALFGGVLGAVVGFLGYALIGEALGVSNFEGGLATGAALFAAPVGAVAGAVLGCLAVMRLRRGKSRKPMGWQGWAALGLTGAGLVGLYLYLFYEPPAPTFRAGVPKPVLHYEIRLPAEMVDVSDISSLRTQLKTYQTYMYPDDVLTHRVDGDEVILSARHTLSYAIEDRGLELWLNQSDNQADYRLLMFDLPIGKVPEPSEDFSDWRPVAHVRRDTYGEDILVEGGHGIFIRTRISR